MLDYIDNVSGYLKDSFNSSDAGNLVETGQYLLGYIDHLSGALEQTGSFLLDYIDSKDDLLHGKVDTVSGDLLSLSGEVDVFKGKSLSTFSKLYLEISGLDANTSGQLQETGSYLLGYIDSEDLFLHERVDTVSGDLLSLSGELDVFKGKSLSTFSKLYLEISGLDQDQAGKLDATGQHLHEHINNLSGQTFASFLSVSEDLRDTGDFLYNFIDNVSGNLTTLIGQGQGGDLDATGSYLFDYIDNLSGQTFASFLSVSDDLKVTGEHLFDYIESVDRHLHGHIDTVSGDLAETGKHLHEHIDNLSGASFASFLSLADQIDNLNTEFTSVQNFLTVTVDNSIDFNQNVQFVQGGKLTGSVNLTYNSITNVLSGSSGFFHALDSDSGHYTEEIVVGQEDEGFVIIEDGDLFTQGEVYSSCS